MNLSNEQYAALYSGKQEYLDADIKINQYKTHQKDILKILEEKTGVKAAIIKKAFSDESVIEEKEKELSTISDLAQLIEANGRNKPVPF